MVGTWGRFDLTFELMKYIPPFKHLCGISAHCFTCQVFVFSGCATVLSGSLQTSMHLSLCFITNGRTNRFRKLNPCKSGKK